MAFQLFEEAAEATKELKKNKKKRASEATGSAMSDSPKGETAAAAAASETPRPKSISPIVEKVDSEVQFKVRQAAVDEEEEEEEVETADDEEEVEDECLVPVEITDSLKRCLEEDQVLSSVRFWHKHQFFLQLMHKCYKKNHSKPIMSNLLKFRRGWSNEEN